MKIKKVICDSGLKGEQYRLRDSYSDFQEFISYSEIYNLHTRLGYSSPKTAWQANPVIQSSVNPSDFRKVKI